MQRNRLPTYVAGAAAIAVVLGVAGVRLTALIPFAILLACPLMMVFMMRGMGGMHGGDHEDHTGHGCEHDPTRTAEPASRQP